jgi:hypothetical protein
MLRWFKHEPEAWRRKTMRCTLEEQGAMMRVLGVLHYSETRGVVRWPLAEVAFSADVPLPIVRALVEKGCLLGADDGHVPAVMHRDRDGVVHTLIDTSPGPLWYEADMVVSQHVHQQAVDAGRRGQQAKRTLKGVPEGRGSYPQNTLKGVGDGPALAIEKQGSESRTLKGGPVECVRVEESNTLPCVPSATVVEEIRDMAHDVNPNFLTSTDALAEAVNYRLEQAGYTILPATDHGLDSATSILARREAEPPILITLTRIAALAKAGAGLRGIRAHSFAILIDGHDVADPPPGVAAVFGAKPEGLEDAGDEAWVRSTFGPIYPRIWHERMTGRGVELVGIVGRMEAMKLYRQAIAGGKGEPLAYALSVAAARRAQGDMNAEASAGTKKTFATIARRVAGD